MTQRLTYKAHSIKEWKVLGPGPYMQGIFRRLVK